MSNPTTIAGRDGRPFRPGDTVLVDCLQNGELHPLKVKDTEPATNRFIATRVDLPEPAPRDYQPYHAHQVERLLAEGPGAFVTPAMKKGIEDLAMTVQQDRPVEPTAHFAWAQEIMFSCLAAAGTTLHALGADAIKEMHDSLEHDRAHAGSQDDRDRVAEQIEMVELADRIRLFWSSCWAAAANRLEAEFPLANVTHTVEAPRCTCCGRDNVGMLTTFEFMIGRGLDQPPAKELWMLCARCVTLKCGPIGSQCGPAVPA